MKMRKVICCILSLIMVFSCSFCAFGEGPSEYYSDDPVIVSQEITDDSSVWIETVGDSEYYTEITDEYTLSIGVVGNYIDYSIKYNSAKN